MALQPARPVQSPSCVHYQEWGQGDPLIALHPLALESTAFQGLGQALAGRGLRTLAADLPGFGKTPAPEGPLTMQVLAEPVLELARSLERPPLLLGHSMGGRVALEVALAEPEAVRGVVMVAPFLPLRRWRRAHRVMRAFDPSWGERLRLEKIWPLLRAAVERAERVPSLEHDWLARAAVRVVYYSSCPATRVAFLSAMREMALDPAHGPRGTWTRLARLAVPTTFLWAGRDALVPLAHADRVAEALPSARQIEIACSGHFVSGEHFRCMQHAMQLAVEHTLQAAEHARAEGAAQRSLAPCLAGSPEPEPVAETVADPVSGGFA